MSFFEQTQLLFVLIKLKAPIAFKVLGLLWLVHLINFLVGYRLNLLGIIPRRLIGIPGIIAAPFLHAGFNHLFFNSIPLFVLMLFVLIKGNIVFYQVSFLITIISGTLIWLLGRPAIHVGASALIMGYWGYLFTLTYEHPDLLSVILLILLLYYFGGGLVLSLFPLHQRTSWEGHLLGLIAGIIVANYYFI